MPQPAPTPNFYSEFLAERDAILEHKWYLSEQKGHDVGFERALSHWVMHHRETWRRNRRQAMGTAG